MNINLEVFLGYRHNFTKESLWQKFMSTSRATYIKLCRIKLKRSYREKKEAFDLFERVSPYISPWEYWKNISEKWVRLKKQHPDKFLPQRHKVDSSSNVNVLLIHIKQLIRWAGKDFYKQATNVAKTYKLSFSLPTILHKKIYKSP